MDSVAATVRHAIQNNPNGDQAGYNSILGHALLQNGKLLGAREAFGKSLNLRMAEGDKGRIGEGLVDLGFSKFMTMNARSGKEDMEAGIRMLRNRAETGFYLRSLKKLELACRVTCELKRADQLRQERTKRALERKYFDQLS